MRFFGLNNLHRRQDAGGTGGGGGGTGDGTAHNDEPRRRREEPARLPANAEAEMQSLIVRQGNAESAVRYLYDENFRLRRRNRSLAQENDGYRTRNPQGSLVLHGADLVEYNAMKALGKASEIKAKIDKAAQTETQLAESKRKEARAAAAKALKYNAAVLEDRLNVTGLDIELREATAQDGTKSQVPYARKAGDANATWEALSTIVERDWKDHIGALKAVPASQNGDGSQQHGGDASSFIVFPDNGASGGGGTPSGTVDKFIAQRNEAAKKRANPLIKSAS